MDCQAIRPGIPAVVAAFLAGRKLGGHRAQRAASARRLSGSGISGEVVAW